MPFHTINSHSDFFMHHEDNSTALDDIFIHSDRQDWALKAPDITTKSKTDDNAKDPNSVSDSLIDIPFLEDVVRTSSATGRALRGDGSMFNSLRDAQAFAVMGDVVPASGLSVDSDQLHADELSEQTGFSGYFSETRTEKNITQPQPPPGGEAGSRRCESPIPDIQSKLVDDSDAPPKFLFMDQSAQKEVQKPPTTAGIGLEDLKAVFHLERPKAEKKLGLKRTTFSNLSRHYGISKWPFRTIRDALNRMEANNRLLENASVSKERRRKLQRQQKLLHDVINLIYSDPRHSRDSNTLAVLLMIVGAKDNQ